MVHPFFDSPKPRIFAHRGFVPEDLARDGILENTRAAFANALAAGADYLESDCHVTRDGTVVLFHDEDLSRTLDDPRAVSEVEYGELERLMAVRGGLLSLEAALTEFPGARWNLDLKIDGTVEPAGALIGQIAADRVLLASFSDERRTRGLAAASRVGATTLVVTSASQGVMVRILLAVALRSRALQARAFQGIDALQIPERQGPIRVLSQRLIEAAHRHGVEVHVWTVNSPGRMRELVRMGIDGIVTDRTDLAVAALR
ncbi:glycerophosphodiester phosphodiesterase family protein [Leucobacter denitrificans]|uniref:Glycerophosphodiester phosphodiesterase n=1 Tax=Leucobacter denitrificans TaxID=683042 RepID=A0A7G9S691_9MICO|nr:glycerophosphodiester phosphodiesterase family protein [Leucobacter denitrificans]QNN63366.1 glycerophosphodiester phosphodiesterase [Leucobacter denitrificans]